MPVTLSSGHYHQVSLSRYNLNALTAEKSAWSNAPALPTGIKPLNFINRPNSNKNENVLM